MVFSPIGRSVSCGICGETCNSRKTLVAKCDDIWCGQCLSTQFEIAVKDETKYPASCCNQELDFAIALKLFSTGLAQQYAAAGVEYSCSPKERVYCASACGTFLGPSGGEEHQLPCKMCLINTCIACRGRAHEGPCGIPEHVTVAKELIEEQKFQKCSNCDNIVEKIDGCNHIKCSHEFCYLCSGDWKDCRGRCQTALDDGDDFRPLWHQHHLGRMEDLLAANVALLRAQGILRHPEFDDFLAAVEQTLGPHQRAPQPDHQPAPVVEQPDITIAQLEQLSRPRPSIFRPSNNELRRERHARCGAEHFRQHNSQGTCRDCGDVDEEVHLACRYCSYTVCFGCFSRRTDARIVA